MPVLLVKLELISVLLCRREFWSCFALQDQKNGMAAFLQKQNPVFTDS